MYIINIINRNLDEKLYFLLYIIYSSNNSDKSNTIKQIVREIVKDFTE
jgi:hypothetical protein